jgi:hypothetical protein
MEYSTMLSDVSAAGAPSAAALEPAAAPSTATALPAQPQADAQAEASLNQQQALLHQEQAQAWQEQVAQWRNEAESDPELGGAALPATVARAQMALNHFDSDDHFVGKLLQESGYGNHPQVLRFFNRLAASMMEDSLSMGETKQQAPLPLEERLYAHWQQ